MFTSTFEKTEACHCLVAHELAQVAQVTAHRRFLCGHGHDVAVMLHQLEQIVSFRTAAEFASGLLLDSSTGTIGSGFGILDPPTWAHFQARAAGLLIEETGRVLRAGASKLSGDRNVIQAKERHLEEGS
jgi:hypothetical protein